MSIDTYQKSRRQRKEYNKHMKQIDESKSQLKSLVKVTSINSPYQIYTNYYYPATNISHFQSKS